MEEDLTELWGKFTLTEAEQDGLEVSEEEVEGIFAKGNKCLVGKLIYERFVGKDFIRSQLVRGWKPTGSISFKVLGENLFLVEFEHEEDKIRVMEGRPWFFEGQLFALSDYDGVTPLEKMHFDSAAFWVRMYRLPFSCMGRAMGFKIGATIGVVEDVDTDEEGISWGQFLRVKVHINFFKPLPRGGIIKLQNKALWVEFWYEKIPKFCFKCGVICHGAGGCVNEELRWKHGRGKENEYGPWMKVGYPKRRPFARNDWYGDDGSFRWEEPPRGVVEARSASQEFSESNGCLGRKEGRRDQEGMSEFSADHSKSVTDTFEGEKFRNWKDMNADGAANGKYGGGKKDSGTFHNGNDLLMRENRSEEQLMGKDSVETNQANRQGYPYSNSNMEQEGLENGDNEIEEDVMEKGSNNDKDAGIFFQTDGSSLKGNLNQVVDGIDSMNEGDATCSKKERVKGKRKKGKETVAIQGMKPTAPVQGPTILKGPNIRTWKKQARAITVELGPSSLCHGPLGKRLAGGREYDEEAEGGSKRVKEGDNTQVSMEKISAVAANQPRRSK